MARNGSLSSDSARGSVSNDSDSINYTSKRWASKKQRAWWKLKEAVAGRLITILIVVLGLIGAIIAVTVVFDISRTTPNVDVLQSGVSILYNNDLDGDRSANQQGALILPSSQNYDGASKSCAKLGENVYDADEENQDFLRFLAFPEGASENDVYWVRRGHNTSVCNTLTPMGQSRQVSCGEQHPTICAQSAPVAHVMDTDRSHKWQFDLTTGDQVYTGYRDRRSFRFFGMKYATSSRWEHSSQYEPKGRFSAINPGPVCTQPGNDGSEDCLFVNVWTTFIPYRGNETSSLKPVMVYIHGGAFVNGHGTGDDTDGGNLASRGDVVVVTLNYRLNTLGFLALDNNQTTGNYGLADQTVALQWVQDHIRDFGGDPTRVTIFGQSAGAASVRALLGVPQARGKFSAAIMQSNLGGTDWAKTYSYYNNVSWAMEWAGNGILEESGCESGGHKDEQLKCLRKMKATDVQKLESWARYLIVDDKYILRPQIALNASADSDETAHVPIMMGTMADDSVAFIPDPEVKNLTKSLDAYGFNYTKIIASGLFPVVNSTGNETITIFNVTARASMDSMYRCLGQATAATAANASTFPSLWYYEFHRAYSIELSKDICYPKGTLDHPWGDTREQYYKCHSGDLAYTFGNIAYRDHPLRDDYDLPFSQYILDLWSSFARNHNPNPDIPYLQARGYNSTIALIDKAGAWYPVGGSRDKWMTRIFKEDIEDVPFTDLEQCDTLGLPITFYDDPTQFEDDPPFPVPMASSTVVDQITASNPAIVASATLSVVG